VSKKENWCTFSALLDEAKSGSAAVGAEFFTFVN